MGTEEGSNVKREDSSWLCCLLEFTTREASIEVEAQ